MNVDDENFYSTFIEGIEEDIDQLLSDFFQPNIENLWTEMQNCFGSENYQTVVEDSNIYSGNHQFEENNDFDAMVQSYEEVVKETPDKNIVQSESSFSRVLDWLINEVHTEKDEIESFDELCGQIIRNVDDFVTAEDYQENTLSNLELEKSFSSPSASTLSHNESLDLFKSISDENEMCNLNNLITEDIDLHANYLKLISNDSSSRDSFNWKDIKQNSPDLFDISDEQTFSNKSPNLLEDLDLYSGLENTSKVSEQKSNSVDLILENFGEISSTRSIFLNEEPVSLNSLSKKLDVCAQPSNLNLWDTNSDALNSIDLNLPNRTPNEMELNVTSSNILSMNTVESNINIQNVTEPNTTESILSENHFEELNSSVATELITIQVDPGDFCIVAEEPARNLSLRQLELMEEVRNLIHSLQTSLNQTGSAQLLIANTNWSNISYENAMLTLNRNGSHRKVSYSLTNNRFKIIMYLLSEIYALFSTGLTCNIRELYYKNPDLCKSQENVVNALKDICCYLNTSPWELKILSTSKGLIAGPIRFITNDNEIIDCNINLQYGTLIPYDVTNDFEVFDSDAKFILIVEKDTIFQKLLQHNVLSKLGELFILITGKGYPDMNTRLIINKITAKFNLPIYILVDGDPFGIEIMLTYKYGSKARVFNSQELACPEVKWIGLYPSEIECLSLTSVPFNCEDKRKLDSLFQKPYLNEMILSELRYFSESNRKAEIEALTEHSVDFLINDYLVKKVKNLI